MLASKLAFAQQPPVNPDSLHVYKDIETFSKKGKVTTFMYHLLFKPSAHDSLKNSLSKMLQLPYRNFEGKIIKNITVVTISPFGHSISDTTVSPQSFASNFGNNLHVKTHTITIKNILLFSANDPFDSLLIKESERLIRSQPYVGDVLLYTSLVKGTFDSVDVTIRVLDKWSISPYGSVSASRTMIGVTDDNFVGLGHTFQNDYTLDYSDGGKAFSTNYFIPNIHNTHVSALLHYNIDEHNNFGKSLAIDRPFYSPLAQWGAGLLVSQLFLGDSIPDTIPGRTRQNLKFNTQDYWGGKASGILSGNTEDERTTKAVTAARYLRIRYLEKPDELHDSVNQYANEDLYLLGIGISKRTYFRDDYIYNFGIIEDVPIGFAYGITSGYQLRNNIGRAYLGARISSGNFFDWGYLCTTVEYGTFFHGNNLEQGVFSVESNCFSNLIKIGNWHLRQFIKPQITLGINRFSYDSLTINNENGIRGFTGSTRGTKKILLSFQTQSYAPWNIFGFRFGPFLNTSLGMLGNETSGFKNSHGYSQIGIGTLIKNDYLIFSNFQLSFAYYPSIPGSGYNILKTNSYTTSDFGFRDFGLGRPEIAAFQ